MKLFTIDDWYKFIRTSSTAHQIRDSGGDNEDVMIALSKQNDELMQKYIMLESICPRRVKTADGTIHIWNCPDHLIPITDVSKI